MVGITPDPSWKEGSKRGTHVVSIDRLKLYHGNTIQAPDSKLDVEMSDDEFAETLHLGSHGKGKDKDPPEVREQKVRGKKEESDDSDNDLGPSPPPRPMIIHPGQGSPCPAVPPKRYPKTPKPKKKDRQPPTPSPPQT